MPCFKGIAVSIHANSTPLSEYGIQRQSKFSRINSFIPVPSPTLSEDSGKTEPAKFAISITLLTPGLPIPYSTPKPTPDSPDPSPQFAARDMAMSKAGGGTGVNPYIPMTNSENETVAAYIYFDGRVKEEVATLLRPGEETWVNSRWVQVPDAEGGGLAEREFLFREVGLERWLNGLDLQGHNTQERLEKRRQKFERRRRRQKAGDAADPAAAAAADHKGASNGPRDNALRYTNDTSPVEAVLDDDDDDDESLSDSDDEFPEAAGQIKVAMFRVIASGEIKKGEYSPQFGAHDDDDDVDGGNSNGVDVEHTTSFAKPKTLDPKTISTQTVTGIDGPEKPYATFTFYYRGERQLQKMGVIPSAKNPAVTPTAAKRRSGQLDLSNLGPLKTTGTVGFSAFRDKDSESAKRKKKSRTKSNGSLGAMDEDSDEDDEDEPEILGKMEDLDDKEVKLTNAPEEANELTEGVDRIRLKRQRSAEPEGSTPPDQKSPNLGAFPATSPPVSATSGAFVGLGNIPGLSSGSASALGKSLPDDTVVGSPLKKQRAGPLDSLAAAQPGSSSSKITGPPVPTSVSAPTMSASSSMKVEEDEEEL